ncbi:hypothetical protein JOM56_013848 [Amanita muscaria]
MDLHDGLSGNGEFPSINHVNSSEALISSSEPHVSLEPNPLDTDMGTVAVDSFLENCHGTKTRKRKTYRAKYRVLSDSNEGTATPRPTSRADILQLRSRRVVRAPPGHVSVHTPEDTDNDVPASPLSRKSKRQLTHKPAKQKRRHLAERLIDAVVRTSGQPNDELLEAGCKDGDLRVPITMETVSRSLIPDKPRKWSLVDPRKVITPFRVSTFFTKRGRKAMTEQTPTSYERVALHRHVAVVTREAVDIDGEAQESSSPCQRKVWRSSLVKKSKVRFCEPLKLDVVSVDAVNKRKCTRKSRTKAATSRLDSRRSKARTPLESETLGEQDVHPGRRSLNMVPVPTRLPSLNTIANKLDGAAAYSGTCPSQSQVDHDFLPVTMSFPTASIPSSSVSELPTSPTVLSPIASSDKNGSQAIDKGSPTLDFEGSYQTLKQHLDFPRK